MTPEEIEFEDEVIRNWWEDTLNGRKPSSVFSTQWEVTDGDLASSAISSLPKNCSGLENWD